MAFWSSQRLGENLSSILDKPDPCVIDCNAITLKIGGEIYITPDSEHAAPNSHTKQILSQGQPFAIPPGQFAFLLTEERITIPPNAMGFISFKARYKLKGLVNVSGFHVDPGWSGPLIFAVFNAGPTSVHLQQGLPLFLLWLADLDAPSTKKKTEAAPAGISLDVINSISGKVDSVYALEKRIQDDLNRLTKKDEELSTRVHELDKRQHRVLLGFAIAGFIVGGIVTAMFGAVAKNLIGSPAATPTPAVAEAAIPKVGSTDTQPAASASDTRATTVTGAAGKQSIHK